jgi:hypothetical protein
MSAASSSVVALAASVSSAAESAAPPLPPSPHADPMSAATIINEPKRRDRFTELFFSPNDRPHLAERFAGIRVKEMDICGVDGDTHIDAEFERQTRREDRDKIRHEAASRLGVQVFGSRSGG